MLLLASCSTGAIAADTCISSLPTHREGHWHYRYVAGEKCWYGPGTDRIQISRRHDRDLAPRRDREPDQTAPAPTPVASIAANIEEEADEPMPPPAVKRVRVIPFTVPLSPNRRLQRTFEELVDACQMSVDACEAFTRR
jgi:hypothetical protein